MIEIFGFDEWPELDAHWLTETATLAHPLCLNQVGPDDPVLSNLEVIEVTLISDDEIAAVHAEFLDDPTPTDVITFHHGEILVSVETANHEKESHGHATEEELLLYIIHGLLHLNGFSDKEEPERTTMHLIQDQIWGEVLATLPLKR